MSKTQELSSFIWTVCDDVLRGLFKPHEYGDVILPFVVLRRLDCVLEPHKDTVIQLFEQFKDKVDDPSPIILNAIGTRFYNTSRYDLQGLRSDAANIRMNLTYYLDGYDTTVREVLEYFQLARPIERLQRANRLYQLIEKFSTIDLHPNVVNNREMGIIYEELLRRFSEMSNETSGDHYTPRDIVRLLVSLLFNGEEERLQGMGIVRSMFDPCAGTGGILTLAKEWVMEHINPDAEFILYGQELNPQTYSICRSDFLLLGENPSNIRGPSSSLSDDRFGGKRFDYQMTNPPFGVSWKSEKDFIQNESESAHGRFNAGTPRVSDGSLLFLQHMISKLNPEGGRIGIVFNGSPLFTGDAGSGESEIRKWIIESDWLECIVALPDQLFFNTGISTYIWIVTNRKSPQRQGMVQLIDASGFFTQMRKSVGDKRKEITEGHIRDITKLYSEFKESEHSKIFPNQFFGYTKMPIEQPLRDEDGNIQVDRSGHPKPNKKLRDYERIPLLEDTEEYFSREVEPHLPDSWMGTENARIGYEINFTKYFYKYKPLRSIREIISDLQKMEEESDGLFNQLMN